MAASIQRKTTDGKTVEQMGKHTEYRWIPNRGELCSYIDGFSLHARVKIHANNKNGLEQLCRYVARPAVSNDRLSFGGKGRVTYKLKKAYADGVHLRFSAKEFVKKLIAIVVPPRINLTRYHGVLAPNSKLRARVVTDKKKKEKGSAPKSNRMAWAMLLKRVFGFEVERCRCGGKLKFLSAILDQSAAVGIMKSLKLPVFVPNPDPARQGSFIDSC